MTSNTSTSQPALANRSSKTWLWLLVAVLVIVIDQATKQSVLHAFQLYQRVNIVPGFFDLILAFNTGAAFSFLAEGSGWQRWLFCAIGVAAALIIIFLLRRYAHRPRFCLSLALILGGALGNVIDRVVYGHVIDFLLFYWHDWYYPAFNIADTAITCGAVLLIIDEFFGKSRRQVV